MLNNNDVKPLQPLTHGTVLIVGAKKSNFALDIIDNPRVDIWDSQDLKWVGKDLPYNVRAVFITKWIGHDAFTIIMKEARKKQITVFNQGGTGQIAKQVRELLDIDRLKVKEPKVTENVVPNATTRTSSEMTKPKTHGKLKVLIPFIDFNRNNSENAKLLMIKANELGISTTFHSLAQLVGTLRSKQTLKMRTKSQTKVRVKNLPKSSQLDVSVQILDNMIKELQDMRDYLVAVTKENEKLKMRMERFKKMFD